MKPEILTIKNIGPFAGTHHIDFTKLGSIFLVCGKTGAGKTTIFDAISYIFFSKPSGSRSGIVRTFRSHFSVDQEIAEVELIFSIGTERYKILRRLPFLKPGNKNERPEEVEFAKFENNTWKDKTSTNKSETDKKIRSLIKLSEKEFSRIVLLPQGEFAEFLKENSNQKRETLSELFPISRYSEIMQLAKDKESAVKEYLKILENSLNEMNTKFNPQIYETEKQRLEDELKLIKKNYDLFNSERDNKKIELEQALMLKKKMEEYKGTCKELEAITAKDGMISLLQKKIDYAIKASPLSEKAKNLKSLESDCEKCGAEIQKIKDNLNYVAEIILEQQNKLPEIQIDKIKAAELKKSCEDLERSAVVFKELEQLKEQKKKYSIAIKEFTGELKTIYEVEKDILLQKEKLQCDVDLLNDRMLENSKLSAKLNYEKNVKDISEKYAQIDVSLKTYLAASEKKKKELEICLKDYSIEQLEMEKLYTEKKEIEKNKSACLLAAELTDGKPCPVCGSLEHPCITVDDGRTIFSIEEKIEKCMHVLEYLQKTKETLNAEYSSLCSSSKNYSDILLDLNNSFEKLNKEYGENIFPELPSLDEIKKYIALTSKQLEEAAAVLKKSQNANSLKSNLENKLFQISEQKNKLEKHISDLKISESGIRSSFKEKEKLYNSVFENIDIELKKTNIEDTIESCKNRILLLDRKVNSFEESRSEMQTKEISLKAVFAEKEILLKKLNDDILAQKVLIAKEMEKYNFDSFETLFEALIPEDEIKKIEHDIKTFTEEKTILKQKAEGLKKDISEKKLPDTEVIKDEIFILEKKLDEESKRLSTVTIERTRLEDFYIQYKNISDEREIYAKNAAVIKSLSGDLNGINSLRLKFDIWILSSFLKEIVVYANKRLKRMSGGRYILKVSREAGGNNLTGLDLEVFDSYTGTSRATASLSGGETFMTSISLALGLADSIESRSGGIRLESMFIDEGFGTLDEASLENAITILDEIRGDRMVGIISHVSELRSRIPYKIEVEKTSKGSRIKI